MTLPAQKRERTICFFQLEIFNHDLKQIQKHEPEGKWIEKGNNMDIILTKNEAEMNENVARGLLGIWGIVLFVDVLCWSGIFDIYFDMTVVLLVAALVTLVIPAVMILKFHFYNDSMKYVIVTAAAIMAGTSYVLFTFQAVIVFVIPALIAGLYMNKRLLYFSGIISVMAIVTAHVITGIFLRQPWIEPFTGMEAILRYGAIPRCLQFSGCFFLIVLMVNRYREIILQISPAERDTAYDTDQSMTAEKEFGKILQELTEREKSVFVLVVSGYTNRQIADKLCLSNGTVKNYVSTIYDKIGTRERNSLIIKYHGFVKENDRSHL